MKKFLSILLSALIAAPMAAGAAVFAEGEAAPSMLWDFGKDGVEMYDESSVETEALEDSVIFTAKDGDPNVKIAADIEDVETIKWVKIRVKNPSPAVAVELFASTDGDNHSLAGPECTHIDIVPYTDEWQSYVAYLPNANIYTVNKFKGAEGVERLRPGTGRADAIISVSTRCGETPPARCPRATPSR